MANSLPEATKERPLAALASSLCRPSTLRQAQEDNSTIGHFPARFRRRTKVVSKPEEMVAATLKL